MRGVADGPQGEAPVVPKPHLHAANERERAESPEHRGTRRCASAAERARSEPKWWRRLIWTDLPNGGLTLRAGNGEPRGRFVPEREFVVGGFVVDRQRSARRRRACLSLSRARRRPCLSLLLTRVPEDEGAWPPVPRPSRVAGDARRHPTSKSAHAHGPTATVGVGPRRARATRLLTLCSAKRGFKTRGEESSAHRRSRSSASLYADARRRRRLPGGHATPLGMRRAGGRVTFSWRGCAAWSRSARPCHPRRAAPSDGGCRSSGCAPR